MKNRTIALLSSSVLLFSCSQENLSQMEYPKSKKVDSTHSYFGEVIKDPYAWLEDDYSEETMAWVDEQNKVTRAYLDQLPALEKLKKDLPKYWDFERYGLPKRTKAGLVYSYNDGKMNQSILKLIDGESEKTLLDPNKFSKDGTASLSSWSISNDGKYLAFGMSKSGSDWVDIKVLDIATGMLLNDEVSWVKFSGIEWDNDGFYYSAFPAPKDGNEYSAKNEFHKVYYHKLGSNKETLIYEDVVNAQRTFSSELDDSKEYLFVYGAESTSGNNIHFKKKGDKDFTAIVEGFKDDYSYVGNYNKGFLFRTNYNAPGNQIIWIDPKNPAKENWKTVVAERDAPLQGSVLYGNKIVLNYLEDVVNKLYSFDIVTGELVEMKTPGLGNIAGLRMDKNDSSIFISFEGYVVPNSIYKYSNLTAEPVAFKEVNLPFNPDNYEVTQHFYTSKDGTQIPIFLTHKKGLEKSPETPCFLYAYGGFNISIQPHFKPDRMAFLEDGGIYAVANIRGGSEYGEAWHQAGIKLNKQNVFDDFIAAAEWLQKEGYTSKEKMAVHGRSNGGLLIGAVLTQRPDLFAVALPKVGVLDMLKYHEFTIGWAWAGDYGRSDESREMYKYLRAYSPVHNVAQKEYPATMVITGDHDDRVVPAHSFKFAAALQANQTGPMPTLLRVDKNAGHGAGKPVEKQVEEFADQWAFVYHHLGM